MKPHEAALHLAPKDEMLDASATRDALNSSILLAASCTASLAAHCDRPRRGR